MQATAVQQQAETTVLAPDLAPGDHIIETGLGGAVGRVSRVSVGPTVIDVTLEDGSRHALARFEVCRVERAERDIPSQGHGWLVDAELAEVTP